MISIIACLTIPFVKNVRTHGVTTYNIALLLLIIALLLYFLALLLYLLVNFSISIILVQYAYFEVFVVVAFYLN